ncbi:hypothetical protein VNO77_22702 [Canavalia gladiata]|uniref:Uncharacterized protein n=1 Tax=Canavalia gladiata TaxID=3824 RepID=A0AAN9L328_CANGL
MGRSLRAWTLKFTLLEYHGTGQCLRVMWVCIPGLCKLPTAFTKMGNSGLLGLFGNVNEQEDGEEEYTSIAWEMVLPLPHTLMHSSNFHTRNGPDFTCNRLLTHSFLLDHCTLIATFSINMEKRGAVFYSCEIDRRDACMALWEGYYQHGLLRSPKNSSMLRPNNCAPRVLGESSILWQGHPGDASHTVVERDENRAMRLLFSKIKPGFQRPPPPPPPIFLASSSPSDQELLIFRRVPSPPSQIQND